MKRRLNIAVSLMHHPRILLMDERRSASTSSPEAAYWTRSALKKEGRTIIFTSHYVDELETLCDRIAIMDKGRILAAGPADELKKANGADDLETVLLRLSGEAAG